jgi:hypothetical protein
MRLYSIFAFFAFAITFVTAFPLALTDKDQDAKIAQLTTQHEQQRNDKKQFEQEFKDAGKSKPGAPPRGSKYLKFIE